MNIHSDAYPEPIGKLQNENKYLKEEIEELKKKIKPKVTRQTLNKILQNIYLTNIC